MRLRVPVDMVMSGRPSTVSRVQQTVAARRLVRGRALDAGIGAGCLDRGGRLVLQALLLARLRSSLTGNRTGTVVATFHDGRDTLLS